MSPPRVSYVVAAYNHERFVRECLLSILAQDFGDMELIVVDDGSSDRTATLAREVAAADSRVQVHAQTNAGVVVARNRGVALSRGEYISIIDSDDLIPCDRTTRAVAGLDANPSASLVYGNAWIINDKGMVQGAFWDRYRVPSGTNDASVSLFEKYCFVPSVSVMFRRCAFDATGGFWGPGPHTDYLKWIELGRRGPPINLGDVKLGYWRLHDTNASRPGGRYRAEQYDRLREALQEIVRRDPDLGQRMGRARVNRRFGECHFRGAFYAGCDGAWSVARAQFKRAWGFHKSSVNLCGFVSALPIVNLVSGPVFRALSRRLRLL